VKLLDFDYLLPDELIARFPLENRSDSRLLVVNRSSSSLTDTQFTTFPDLLSEGDCLVLNETKVIPARLFAKREKTGADIEIFLTHRQADRTDTWNVLAAPAKKVKVGELYRFSELLSCEVLEGLEQGERVIRFNLDHDKLEAELEKIGKMPIPPYLKRESTDLDRIRYQTVFAHIPGAVAAPTASLHFTDELLRTIEAKGVRIAKVILHVGLGTFKPVEVDDIRQHTMHSEEFEVSGEAARIINETKKSGKRIIAVGTTAARTLETVANDDGTVTSAKGETAIFIYPPYQFKTVDALLTNFHQPKSTLLMMISALAGYELIMEAYQHAIRQRYRFLSYGDAMFIV
jgi:S-adenosylmethionine:tRNA ribosyltransferase-isomerase